MQTSIPRWIHQVFLALTILALIPPVLIARARVSRSEHPRIHPIPDMDNQKRYKTQMENPVFADLRANRPPIEGTVARGEYRADDHYFRGYAIQGDGTIAYFDRFPSRVTVDEPFLRRGQERYGIYCAPCHGYNGGGLGMVAKRALSISESYTQPYDLVLDARGDVPLPEREVGHIFNTISNGIRNMPAYRFQIPVKDRWAIVAYVRALQKSKTVPVNDLPASVDRSQLPVEPRVPGTTGQ